MAQIKIYGVAERLIPRRAALSDVIHDCVVQVLGLPPGKRAHRFFPLATGDFVMPSDRSLDYTILEITMMSGRTVETRKRLIRTLFDQIEARLAIAPQDLELCISEVPPENWGFRGLHGDEAVLDYRVRV
jgi:phenylpyruvate tautomerase PptA (4-oxalocrotonate tautomerase family)